MSSSPGPVVRKPRGRLSDEIRDLIIKDLLSGQIEPGQNLPTEADLGRMYSASRATIRESLRSLHEVGLVAVRQGQRSTVLPRPRAIASGLDRLGPLESFAANQNAEVTNNELEFIEIEVGEEAAQRLERPVGTSALIIQRIKQYDGVPVAWIVDYIPDGVLPYATLQDEFDGSVLDVLMSHAELEVEYSDCAFTGGSIPVDVARRLQVGRESPAIFLEETTRNRSGTVVGWSYEWLLPSYFSFTIRRRPQFGASI